MVNYAREVGWESHSGEKTRATEGAPKSGMQRPPERGTFKQNPPGTKNQSLLLAGESSEMSCRGLQ